jgi:hypothetical protein
LLKAWDYFSHEQELNTDVEVIHFTIKKKKHIYIWLGSFNKNNHLQQTSSDIWAASISGTLRGPRIQTAAMSTQLTVEVGKLDLICPTIKDSINSRSYSSSESDSEKHSDSDCNEEKDDVSPVRYTDLLHASESFITLSVFNSGSSKSV